MTAVENKRAAEPGEEQAAKITESLSGHSSKKSNSFHKKTIQELEEECLVFMANHDFPLQILEPTKRNSSGAVRLSIDGGDDEDEWYFYDAGISNKGNQWLQVTFGTYAGGKKTLGTYQSWKNDINISPEEVKEFQKSSEKRAKEKEKILEDDDQKRVQEALKQWNEADEEPPSIYHEEYLSRKQVDRFGVRFSFLKFKDSPQPSPTIVVPLKDLHGSIQGVQHIRGDGKKRFRGCVTGNFHQIGNVLPNSTVRVCEGYATACSVHQATLDPTIVAFDCGNLDPVIANLRKRYPKNRIIICGDDDFKTEQKGNGNPGKDQAQKAAKKYGCEAIFPKFLEKNLFDGSDFNDLHVLEGLETAKDQLIDPWYKKNPIPFREVPLTFNSAILPHDLNQAIEEWHRFIKAPKEAIIASAITSLMCAVGKAAHIEEIPGLDHHARIGTVIVIPSGERKSEVFKQTAKELDEYENTRRAAYEEEIKLIKAKNHAIDEEIKSLKRKKGENFDEYLNQISALELKKKPFPPSPKVYSTDVTEQRLFELADDRNGEFAVLSGEGRTAANNILGKNNKSGEAGDSIFLAGQSGDKINRDRIGTNGERIERTIMNPCINFGIMIQADKWSEMAKAKNLQESGFLARLFVVYPTSAIGYRLLLPNEKRGLEKEKTSGFHSKIKSILESKDKNRKDNKTHKVFLDEETKKARDELYNYYELNSRVGEKFSESDLTKAIASKFTTKVCILALALHIYLRPDQLSWESSFLKKSTWDIAKALGEFFLNETLRAMRCISKTKKEIVPIEEKLIIWLSEKRGKGEPANKPRDIQQFFRPKLKSVDAVKNLIKKLEEHHCARLTPNGDIELHPFIKQNGIDWLKGTSIPTDPNDFQEDPITI